MVLNEKFPQTLLVLYCLFFAFLAIDPRHRGYWVAANIAPIAITLFFVLSFKRFRFSNLSYFLSAFLLFLQTLGAHYFFYLVPFDLITDIFNFTRHNFDRMVHVTVGFFAYPIGEFVVRKKIVAAPWAVYLFSFALIMTAAGLYEIFEWMYLLMVSPESGPDFLGAQGDIWDAQKDMLADGVGAVLVLILFYFNFPSLSSRKL